MRPKWGGGGGIINIFSGLMSTNKDPKQIMASETKPLVFVSYIIAIFKNINQKNIEFIFHLIHF